MASPRTLVGMPGWSICLDLTSGRLTNQNEGAVDKSDMIEVMVEEEIPTPTHYRFRAPNL